MMVQSYSIRKNSSVAPVDMDVEYPEGTNIDFKYPKPFILAVRNRDKQPGSNHYSDC